MSDSIQGFEIMFGDDNDHTRAWQRLNQAAQNGSRPHASQAGTFWKVSPPGFPDDDNDGPGEDNPPPDTFTIPAPILFCPSCLCVADQIAPDAWRCRNEACGAVARIGDLLTTSELIKRRAALERIRVNVLRRLTCRNCGGFHAIQKCPELSETLFIGAADASLGCDLMRLRWIDYRRFVNMLINAEPPRLLHYAESYVAFIRSHTPTTTLTGEIVLSRWQREIQPDDAPAMQAAA